MCDFALCKPFSTSGGYGITILSNCSIWCIPTKLNTISEYRHRKSSRAVDKIKLTFKKLT